MVDISSFSMNDLFLRLLVFVRVGSLFSFAPFFSGRTVPVPAKIILAVFLTFFIAPFVPSVALPLDPLGMTLAIFREAAVGYILGALTSAYFASVTFAGELVSNQMNFSMGGIFNPDSDAQTTVVAEGLYLLASVLFLAMNGHLQMLDAIATSYRWVPPAPEPLGRAVAAAGWTSAGYAVFTLGLKLAAPAMVALWTAGLGMAVIARFLPQLNIFILDMPMKCALGFALLAVTLPRFAQTFIGGIGVLWKDLRVVLMAGG